jgi:hypothetical protein
MADDERTTMIDFVPHFTVEEARVHGASVGIDWDKAAFSDDEFRRAMCIEYECALEDPDTTLTPQQTARVVVKNLFEFPDFYTREDMLEAAYDVYWSERTD